MDIRIKKSGLKLIHSKVPTSELGTLEWDTFNPDCLIRISNNMDTFNFSLYPLFFGYSSEKSKTGFSNLEKNLSFLYINPKWREKF